MPGGAYVDAPRNAERLHGGLPATIIAVTDALRSRLAIWCDRARYRRILGQMSERELIDIGVSWSDIAGEVSKPFWRD